MCRFFSDSADLAIAVADYLLAVRPDVGSKATVLDAAITAAATTIFKPEVHLS